jgi:hypothetical protein
MDDRNRQDPAERMRELMRDRAKRQFEKRLENMSRLTDEFMRRMDQYDPRHVALGLIAKPEIGSAESGESGGIDESFRRSVAITKRAAEVGRDLLLAQQLAEKFSKVPELLEAVATKVGAQSKNPSPPAADRTPISDSAWRIARERFRKNRGDGSV